MEKRKIIFWSLTDSVAPKNVNLEEGIGPYKLAAIADRSSYDPKVFQASQFGCDPAKIEKVTKSESNGDAILALSVFSTAEGLLEKISQQPSFLHHPIILGGPGATISPRRFLEHFNGNNRVVLVQGDGEELFERLLKTETESWKDLNGVWAYDHDNLKIGDFQRLNSLDSSPFADLSFSHQREIAEIESEDESLSLERRIEASRSLSFSHFEARRGCYYHCEFCSEPGLAARGVRRMSPQRVVDEMKYMHDIFGIAFFNFSDNIAFDSKEWWAEFSKDLKDSRISEYITFGGYGTPKFFSSKDWFDGTLQSMKDAGLAFVTLGVQSGSKRILKEIIKRPDDDPENAIDFIKKAVPMGINVKTDFIVGHPTEEIEDISATHRAVKEIYGLGGQVFARRLNVLPNSGYERNLEHNDYSLPERTPEFCAIEKQILAYHGDKSSFRSQIRHGIPNLCLIDREIGIRYPKNSMSLGELEGYRMMLKDSNMPSKMLGRYHALFDLMIRKKSRQDGI